MKSFDIYWDDLTEAKKKELLEMFGDNNNWDVFPITTVEVEDFSDGVLQPTPEAKTYYKEVLEKVAGDNAAGEVVYEHNLEKYEVGLNPTDEVIDKTTAALLAEGFVESFREEGDDQLVIVFKNIVNDMRAVAVIIAEGKDGNLWLQVGYHPYEDIELFEDAHECECPLGGDETDDCADCPYAADYYYDSKTGDCVRRDD